MDISLVIPAYNEEKYIGKTIESVLLHAPGKFKEIIVVDNASTDDTSLIASTYPGVRVVREERKGTGFARERGFRESTGEVIAFIDADTHMRPKWFDRVHTAFTRDPKLVCISGPYWYYDLATPVSIAILASWYGALPVFAFIKTFVIGGNFAIRRETLEKMRGFDTSIVFYGDDIDVGRRASKFGKVRPGLTLTLDSSGRRFKSRGILKTIRLYASNSFSVMFLHRPHYTPGYDEVR